MEYARASASCVGCERLEGILEERIPTWQERVEEVTGLSVAQSYGSNHLDDEPPFYVRLEDESLVSIDTIKLAWYAARNDHREREMAVSRIVQNCPGYSVVSRKCGQLALGEGRDG